MRHSNGVSNLIAFETQFELHADIFFFAGVIDLCFIVTGRKDFDIPGDGTVCVFPVCEESLRAPLQSSPRGRKPSSTGSRRALYHGASIAGFVTQALFLMNSGLENEITDFESLSSTEQVELSRQIKLLTLPSEMGESFKCIGLSKGIVPSSSAFDFGDRAHIL